MPNTLRLPCRLTTEEKLALGDRKAAAQDALDDVKAKKKDAVSVFNKQIKGFEGTIHTLNEAWKSGEEDREVEVRTEKDPDTGVVRTIRCDTGETVNLRDIDPDERQIDMGLDGPKVGGEKTDLAEEQEAATPEEAEAMREARLRQEKRARTGDALAPLLTGIGVLVLPNEEDGFTAQIGVTDGYPWTEVVSAKGDSETDARDALRTLLIDIVLAAEAAASMAEHEAVLVKLGELLEKVTIEKTGAGVFVAKVDAGDWTSEASGESFEDAAAKLRAKLVEILTEDAAKAKTPTTWDEVKKESAERAAAEEIAKLAADQARDAAKDPPRRGLKPPTKGPKPKKHGRSKGDAPVTDDDGKPLGF